jgi:formate dehydrogenase major subunit
MGCEPHHLTGYAALEPARGRFESIWGARLPWSRGLDLMEMVDAASQERLGALYAIGYDVLLTNPDAARTRDALSRLELLVVQDLFMNETARDLATVFLPCASAFEKDGTFMNAERRIQRVRRVIAPPGEARTDWEIVCALATAMDCAGAFSFESAEQIWNEIRSVWPAGAGISYPRLDRGGIQWPCPSDDHPGTAFLHAGRFVGGDRATLRPVEYRPSSEATSDGYPLRLITGRKLYQFNAATMTGRTPNLELQPTDALDVSPQDAAAYGLSSGDRALVRSRHGQATLTVQVAEQVSPGEVFATFHGSDTFVNRVTGHGRDPMTHTPEYKVTAVQLTKR